MLDRQQAFHLARLLCKAIPNMPGKLRIARFALRPLRGLHAGSIRQHALLPELLKSPWPWQFSQTESM
jgi:hypothetical protein